MQYRSVALACVSLALATSCSKKNDNTDGEGAGTAERIPEKNLQPRTQWYRMELAAEGGPVPFVLEVQLPLAAKSTATVINGEERISREMTCDDVHCVVNFSVFGSTLDLDFSQERRPAGMFRYSEYYPGHDMSVTGTAVNGGGSEYRYVSGAEPAVDISGEWVLDIKGVGPGKAGFEQNDDGTVQGWIVPTNIGDVRYLDGRVSGTKARLSTFDGQHAYNVDLKFSEDGKTLEGVWHYHDFWHYEMQGQRGKGPTLDDLHTIRLKPGLDRLTLPELEERIGKPVILDFYGTWCSTCIDLMPVLVDLNARYKDQGLEIFSIAFEPSDDEKLVAKQVKLFEEKYGITWKSSTRDVEDLDVIFEQLENTEGFPITFFINRDGTLQGLHSGFVSAAAKEEHANLLAKYERLTQEILASKAP